MAKEVIIKVLDDEEMKPQFSQDGNVYKATFTNPYENMGELVRCKDCKFNEGYCENETFNHRLEPLGLDGGALFETRPDFYCAYGKRKEE